MPHQVPTHDQCLPEKEKVVNCHIHCKGKVQKKKREQEWKSEIGPWDWTGICFPHSAYVVICDKRGVFGLLLPKFWFLKTASYQLRTAWMTSWSSKIQFVLTTIEDSPIPYEDSKVNLPVLTHSVLPQTLWGQAHTYEGQPGWPSGPHKNCLSSHLPRTAPHLLRTGSTVLWITDSLADLFVLINSVGPHYVVGA